MAIRSRGAEYVLRAKAHQPKLYDQLQDPFTEYTDDWQGVRRSVAPRLP